MSQLGRVIWLPFAFLISAIIAGFVLFSLGLERVTQAMAGRGFAEDSIPALFDLVRQAALLTSGITLLPAILVVIVGEIARIRSSLYYILGGGAALAVMPLIARLGDVDTVSSAMPPVVVWQVFATAGFAGGWIYWLIAGRRA